MNQVARLSCVALASVALFAHPAKAQTADYLTEGVDSARTGWMKQETRINKSNAGSLQLLWTRKLPSKPREMHNLFSPLIAGDVATSAGSKDIAIVAGISDDLWALDAKSGEVLWSKHFDIEGLTGQGPQSGTLCPTGQTAVPTLEKTAEGKYTIWALAGDGRIRQIDAATGKDLAPPDRFAPPAGKAYALNKVGDVIYTVLAQGCGGATYQMDAYNVVTHRTTALYPGGGGLWGRRGTSVDAEGRAYEGTGDGPYDQANKQLGNVIFQAKLDEQGLLQMQGWFAPPNANYLYKHDLDMNVTPIALDFMHRKFLIATSKECRLWLLDRDNMGGGEAAKHRATLNTTGLICNDRQQYDGNGVWGAPAAYVNARNEAWVYVPFWGRVSDSFHPPLVAKPEAAEGGVAAFQLVNNGGTWKLAPRWLSENMKVGENAIVANDLVFAYGSGEDAMQSPTEREWDSPPVTGDRIRRSTHATIFVLDARTGKTLWSSGQQITSFNHFSGITVANGKIYLGTFDGTMYCFGLPQ